MPNKVIEVGKILGWVRVLEIARTWWDHSPGTTATPAATETIALSLPTMALPCRRSRFHLLRFGVAVDGSRCSLIRSQRMFRSPRRRTRTTILYSGSANALLSRSSNSACCDEIALKKHTGHEPGKLATGNSAPSENRGSQPDRNRSDFDKKLPRMGGGQAAADRTHRTCDPEEEGPDAGNGRRTRSGSVWGGARHMSIRSWAPLFPALLLLFGIGGAVADSWLQVSPREGYAQGSWTITVTGSFTGCGPAPPDSWTS